MHTIKKDMKPSSSINDVIAQTGPVSSRLKKMKPTASIFEIQKFV